MGGIRICIFGDSIVWGAMDYKYGGWVDQFKLTFVKTGKLNEVFNLGDPGDYSSRLLKRFENEIKARLKLVNKDKHIVMFQIGLNDSKFLSKSTDLYSSPSQFEKNIREMINISKKYVNTVIMISSTPVDESKNDMSAPNKSYKNDWIRTYNEIIRSVCEENNVLFIDVFGDWLKLDYHKLLSDGVHPNSEGHCNIHDFVVKVLTEKKILK